MPTFQPVHPQPFTFDHACQLDSPTISAEISRLQHSLQALNSTQKQLQEALSEASDSDLEQAFQENSAVIASQEERIVMLRNALEAQGAAIADNPHYNVQPLTAPSIPPPVAASALPDENRTIPSNVGDGGDSGGIYL